MTEGERTDVQDLIYDQMQRQTALLTRIAGHTAFLHGIAVALIPLAGIVLLVWLLG